MARDQPRATRVASLGRHCLGLRRPAGFGLSCAIATSPCRAARYRRSKLPAALTVPRSAAVEAKRAATSAPVTRPERATGGVTASRKIDPSGHTDPHQFPMVCKADGAKLLESFLPAWGPCCRSGTPRRSERRAAGEAMSRRATRAAGRCRRSRGEALSRARRVTCP